MTPIFCVSYPRSGSTWLQEAMHAVVPGFSYCEGYVQVFDPAKHNFLKSHDFDLKAEPPPGFVPILLLRNPLNAVTSYWNLTVANGHVKDTYSNWKEWSESAFGQWRGLYDKWIDRAQIVIWMEGLQLWPFKYLYRIHQLMTGTNPNIEKLTLPPFKISTSYRDFHHYRKLDFEMYSNKYLP